MAVIAVQVPNVRAERGVTGDVVGSVCGGSPFGGDFELLVGLALPPQYTFCVGARDTYAWMLLASETTEIWYTV